MLLRPLKPWHLLLLIPYALVSGLAYGLIAQRLVRDREPWFTLLMLGGLGLTITLIAWPAGIPLVFAGSAFLGTGCLYVVLRLIFGRGSAVEMFAVPQVVAVLVLFCWPFYQRLQAKAHPAARGAASCVCCLHGALVALDLPHALGARTVISRGSAALASFPSSILMADIRADM